ncbi:MAG: hypothetical protein H0W33_01625 [Gammaproteobacteria bacterium]|nr:hypothetical protein [Gammaproteobacteria bacterium]
MMTARQSLAVACFVIVALAGCTRKPNIPFAEYGDAYASKPDFADVEHRYPLTPEDLDKLTPSNLAKLTQEELDQVYARLTAGPVPDGPYEGSFFFADGGGAKRLAEVFGGVEGLAVRYKLEKLEAIGQALWKGKVFYRDERLLRNMIRDRRYLEPIIDDLDSIPEVEINGKNTRLLFPARLYCGQSLLDGRRESIVIDYAFSDEIDGYREKPDFLAGRRGLKVRDEIRMIRPGFYLGRAYLGRVFLLNFTLHSQDIADAEGNAGDQAGQTQQDCWPGTQRPDDRPLTAAREPA